MKRISKSILICMVLCLSVMFFTSCSCGKQTKVEDIAFNSPFVDLFLGDVYEANAVILPSNASNNRVVYRVENPKRSDGGLLTVLRKTSENEFVANAEGEAILYATSVELGAKNTVSQKVRVFSKKIKLDTPIGLKYDGEKVVWDKVSYSLAETKYDAFGYIVNLNGVDLPINAENTLLNLACGIENKIKVKAVSDSEAIEASDYSSEISVYILPSPKNLQRQGKVIYWDEVENAGSYDIYVNGERYAENITELSYEIDFETSGNYAVSVVANPVKESQFVYSSYPSETISIVKLDKVEQVSIENGMVRWNEVLKALEYKVLIENNENQYSFNTGIYNSFDLASEIAGIKGGDYNLYVVAVSNETSGINSNKSEAVAITKLFAPTNLRVENNALVWDEVENASKYTLVVDNGDEQIVEKSFTLPSDSRAGAYVFKMKAYGDGVRYFDSDLTSEQDAFEAIKLQAPESITNSNNVINSNAIENASAYRYFDYADEQNVLLFADEDVENLGDSSSMHSAKLVLRDKISINDIILSDTNKKSDIEIKRLKYAILQARLNENYFKIKVQAVAVSGQNYFDSSISENFVDFHKLFAPVSFNIVLRDGATWVYDCGINVSEFDNPESYRLYSEANLLDGVLRTNIRFQQMENEKLVDRFVHTRESGQDSIAEEMKLVKGGNVYMSLSYVGNGTTVIESDYSYARLATKWEYGPNGYIVTEEADCEKIIPRMYEPTNLYIDGIKLNFSVMGDDNEEYVLELKNEKDEYEKVYQGKLNSIDLSNIVRNIGKNDFNIRTVANDNFDFTKNIKSTEKGIEGTATMEDKFSFASKNVEFSVTRLNAPIVSLEKGYIVWDAVEGADGYAIYVNGMALDRPLIGEENGKYYWYPLEGVTSADKVQVVAKAPHSHNAEYAEMVMDSPLSDAVSYERLIVKGFTIENDVLTIDTDEEDVNVILEVLNLKTNESVAYESKELAINLSFTIKNSGDYQIAFYLTRKDGVEQNKLNSNIIANDVDGKLIYIKVLDNPTLQYNKETFVASWTKVDGATGYKVAYRVAGSEEVSCSNVINETECDLSLLEDINSGVVYDISVIAVGKAVKGETDSNYIISSFANFEENAVTIERMKEVSNLNGLVDLGVYKLEWDAVENASYNVFMNGKLLSNVTTNSYAVQLDEMSEVGEYEFTVRTVSNDNSKLSSLYSDVWKVTRLDKPQLSIKNGAIYVANYQVECGDATLRIYNESNALIYTGKYAMQEISVDDIVELGTSGKYKFVVNFEGNSVNSLASEASEIENISRVSAVTGFVLNSATQRLEWNAVEGVSKYKVVYINKSTLSVVAEYFTTTYAVISSGVSEGEFSAMVYAVGNDSNLVNSIKSEIVTFTKLETVKNVVINNGILTFDKNANADKYTVKIAKNGQVKYETFTYSESGHSMNLGAVGTYEISVQAVGDFVNFVSSNYSDVFSVVNLDTIENIEIMNNTMSWDEVENALSYKVVLSGASDYEVVVDTNSYEIERDKLAGGLYNVQVIALGDGKTVLSSSSAIITNAFEILAKVQNIGFNEYKQIVWDVVNRASSYHILITGENGYSFEKDLIANVIDLPQDLVGGQYVIKVMAIGDKHLIVDSAYSNDYVATKFEAPEKISHKSGVLSVSPVSGVTDYMFEIEFEDGSKVVLDADTNSYSATYDFAKSGLYTIKAYSKGDYVHTVNSELSEQIEVRKLDSVLFEINGDWITWGGNEYVENNSFGYKVVVSDNEAGENASEVIVYDTKYNLSALNFDSGEVFIKVQCLAGNETSFLPSDFASGSRTFANALVLDEKFTNNNITWKLDAYGSAIKNAISGYEIKVVDSANKATLVQINDANETKFTLGDDFNAGKYKVSVRILGNGTALLNSKFSEEKEVSKLASSAVTIKMQNESNPTSNYIATWDVVENASSYVVVLNNFKTITTTNNYIVLDAIDTLEIGENSIRLKVNGNDSYYMSSKLSDVSTFTVLDNSVLNLRIENGVIVWDSANTSDIKLYQLKLNEAVIDCGTKTSFELNSTYKNGLYKISMKIIAKSNKGSNGVIVNSYYTSVIEGYKLQTPDAPKIVNGMLKVGSVDYKNMEEDLTNRLNYQIIYGNYDEIVVFDKLGNLTKAIYSDKINEQSEIKYRAIGDSYNLNSDWTNTLNRVDGVQLDNSSSVYMRDGVLCWNAVQNATKYKLIAKVVDELGEIGENQYELFVNSTSIEKPFFYDLFKETGVTFAVSVVSIGTEDSMLANINYTNSTGTENYTICYLPQAFDIISKEGTLLWTGTSVNGYDLEIDGNIKFVQESYYNFESENAGKHTVRVRLKGNSEEIVGGLWSDYAVVYKISTPTYVVDSFIKDGMVAWNTSEEFLKGYTNADIDALNLFKYVQILVSNDKISEILLTKDNIITTLSNGNYSSILNDYFDNLDAGTYAFRIKNLGTTGSTDLDRFISSVFANSFIASILEAPQDVRVENGLLQWTNVENNNGYIVEIGKQDGTTEILKVGKTQNQDACFIDLSDYAVGKYSFKLRAMGDSGRYLTSKLSEEVKVEVLSCPTDIGMEEGTLTWDTILGASNYTIKAVNVVNSAEFEFANISAKTENGKDYFELPEDLVAGTYDVYIKSIGDGIDYISSKYMANAKRIIKLADIEGFGNTLGKLSWNESTLGDGTKALGYRISIESINADLDGNTNFEFKAYRVPKNGTSAQIKVVDGVCYFELPSYIPMGDLTIKVKALGDNDSTASSSYTEQISATKLEIIEKLYLEDGVIKWTYDTLGREGFYLVVGGGAVSQIYEDNLIKSYSTEFPSELPADSYDVYLKVVGNTVANGSMDKRYLNSNLSEPLEIVKLAQVNGFTVYDGVLVWNEVSGASNYELTFYKDGQSDIVAKSFRYNGDIKKYYFSPQGLNNDGTLKYGDGNYKRITIRALGGSNFINSQEVEVTNILKLVRPSSIDVVSGDTNAQELKLKWQIVSYTINDVKMFVKKYRLKLVSQSGQEFEKYVSYDNGDIKASTTTLEASTFFECDINSMFDIGSGTYLLSIQACSLPMYGESGYEVWNTINSDYSVNVSVTKPAPPANLMFDDELKAFTWTKPQLDSTLEVSYNVTYIYKTSDTVDKYEVVSEITNNTYFYPRKLGVYYVAVKAIVSGNLTSDYVGKNNINFLSIKQAIGEGLSDSECLEKFLKEYGAKCGHDLFDSGEGTADKPYIIKTAKQLENLNYYCLEDMYFELANSINFAGSSLSIGSKARPFAGTLNGNQCSISNVNLNGTADSIGIFAYVQGATIRNLILSNITLSISRQENTYAGLLVGYAEDVVIENVLVGGSISQTGAGTNSSTFYLGGVLGYGKGQNTSINKVRNMASISYTAKNTALIVYSAGIAGYFEASEGENSGIIACGNEGNIQGTIAGGIVANGVCPILNCYNTGSVSATVATSSDAYAGGIAGRFMNTDLSISNTYNVGAVTASSTNNKNCYAGGLVGRGACRINYFYNGGTITTSKLNASQQTAGWLVGQNVSSGIDAYYCYNISTSTTQNSGSGPVSEGCETLSETELINAVQVYLGSAFSYSSAKKRVVLVIESQLLG